MPFKRNATQSNGLVVNRLRTSSPFGDAQSGATCFASSRPSKLRRSPANGERRTVNAERIRSSASHLARTFDEVFVAGQFFQAHRTAGVKPICANSNLSAKTELGAVIEPRRGIPEHGRRIDLM
jgi:hypothetical protein